MFTLFLPTGGCSKYDRLSPPRNQPISYFLLIPRKVQVIFFFVFVLGIRPYIIIVRESLNLSIKYRLLREGMSYSYWWFQTFHNLLTFHDFLEVESLVAEAVQTTVAENSSWLSHSDSIVGKLIEALETDASWVELFGTTGELKVPDKDEQELVEALQRVKEVCCFYQ